MVKRVLSKVVEEEVVVTFSHRCLVVEWEEEVEAKKEVHKKENQFNIPLKLPLKKYIKEKHQKLP